jgi:hypothetical protein
MSDKIIIITDEDGVFRGILNNKVYKNKFEQFQDIDNAKIEDRGLEYEYFYTPYSVLNDGKENE